MTGDFEPGPVTQWLTRTHQKHTTIRVTISPPSLMRPQCSCIGFGWEFTVIIPIQHRFEEIFLPASCVGMWFKEWVLPVIRKYHPIGATMGYELLRQIAWHTTVLGLKTITHITSYILIPCFTWVHFFYEYPMLTMKPWWKCFLDDCLQ